MTIFDNVGTSYNSMPLTCNDDSLLKWEHQRHGKGAYTVVNPCKLYRGKSYSEWTTDWFNWFLSAHSDKRNSGPVVFLRSKGIPYKDTDLKKQDELSDSWSASHLTEADYPTPYVNDPNIRVGNDRLHIFEDQAVFAPIIISYQLGGTFAQFRDWGSMQDEVGLIIDNGDNPPEPYQLTIDHVPIHLSDDTGEKIVGMADFRINTPIFTAVVPDSTYGSSVKDFLEEGPIPAGIYPAMVDGYFVILKFKPGTYWVHSWASAGREARGPYFSEFLYEIIVRSRPVRMLHGCITDMRPAHHQGLFEEILRRKRNLGQLTSEEVKKMGEYCKWRSIDDLKARTIYELKETLEVTESDYQDAKTALEASQNNDMGTCQSHIQKLDYQLIGPLVEKTVNEALIKPQTLEVLVQSIQKRRESLHEQLKKLQDSLKT